ncbi:unnamed protein product [Merluccius merluccius]
MCDAPALCGTAQHLYTGVTGIGRSLPLSPITSQRTERWANSGYRADAAAAATTATMNGGDYKNAVESPSYVYSTFPPREDGHGGDRRLEPADMAGSEAA